MRIHELISNEEFSFNVPFRVLHYLGHGDETQVVFDSTKSNDFPFGLMEKYISAINTGDDGVLEIEYVNLIGEEG